MDRKNTGHFPLFMLALLGGLVASLLGVVAYARGQLTNHEQALAQADAAQRQWLPTLFQIMRLPEPEARLAIAQDNLAPLKHFGPPNDPISLTVSEGAPLSVQLGQLTWNWTCPIALDYLQSHPESLTQTQVRFNGDLLSSETQLRQASCGTRDSRSTLVITAL